MPGKDSVRVAIDPTWRDGARLEDKHVLLLCPLGATTKLAKPGDLAILDEDGAVLDEASDFGITRCQIPRVCRVLRERVGGLGHRQEMLAMNQ
jgi:hypothetical protein